MPFSPLQTHADAHIYINTHIHTHMHIQTNMLIRTYMHRDISMYTKKSWTMIIFVKVHGTLIYLVLVLNMLPQNYLWDAGKQIMVLF